MFGLQTVWTQVFAGVIQSNHQGRGTARICFPWLFVQGFSGRTYRFIDFAAFFELSMIPEISKFTQSAGLNLVLHNAVQALHEPVSDGFGLPQAKHWAIGQCFRIQAISA